MKNLMFIPFVGVIVLLVGCKALDNGLARTPPMGWMSWERFRCQIDCVNYPDDCLSEQLIRETADRMAEDGFLESGYEYIIIDDCWASKERDEEGRLQGDLERFPSGMKALADYVHSKGLKFGIYGDYGNYTCGGYPGSLQYLELDAQTWADWGVDYLKLDGCYVSTDGIDQGYGQMTKYLNATDRPIVFSCSFPAYVGIEANYTAAVEYCNLWRNYGDIDDSFDAVKNIASWFSNNQDYLNQFHGPGHWNDPDMLIIGNTGLTSGQSKIQMSIWSLMAVPLLMSTDLRTISAEDTAILQNKDILRINQDSLGLPGRLEKDDNSFNIWKKPILSEDGSSICTALGIMNYNEDDSKRYYSFTLQSFDLINNNGFNVQNIWEPENNINHTVSSLDVINAKILPACAEVYIICPVGEES